MERLERRLEVLEKKSGEAAAMERLLTSIQHKAVAGVQKNSEALSALQVEYAGTCTLAGGKRHDEGSVGSVKERW